MSPGERGVLAQALNRVPPERVAAPFVGLSLVCSIGKNQAGTAAIVVRAKWGSHEVQRCLPVRVTALPYSFGNGPQAGNTLAVQLAMVGGEELQADKAAFSQGAELCYSAQRQVH
jgi:hypothetical protein